MNFLRTFAAETTEAQSDIFTALGIDWRLLIIQIVAFVVLVALLGKFVYPWLMKSVDARQEAIEAAQKATAEAQKAAAKQQADTAELMDQARKQAADIVETAKLESAELLSVSEKKARQSAEKIVSDAKDQIEHDVARARKDLYNDTLELVGLATEKVAGKAVSKSADEALITQSLKEAK
jgi:F-type H+-transporting ATPase subunit b